MYNENKIYKKHKHMKLLNIIDENRYMYACMYVYSIDAPLDVTYCIDVDMIHEDVGVVSPIL